MYLRHLIYLRLVIEQGSFAAAAQAAGVSQPAISHAMKQLQQQFTAPLLVRFGRRSVPTELALQLASEVASLEQRMDALVTASPPRADRDVLRIGLTPSAALVCGPILYDGWCSGHPRRRLELTSADEGSLLAGCSGVRSISSWRPSPEASSPEAWTAGRSIGFPLLSTLVGRIPLSAHRRSKPCRAWHGLVSAQACAGRWMS